MLHTRLCDLLGIYCLAERLVGAVFTVIGVPLPGDRNEPYFMPDEDLQDV